MASCKTDFIYTLDITSIEKIKINTHFKLDSPEFFFDLSLLNILLEGIFYLCLWTKTNIHNKLHVDYL